MAVGDGSLSLIAVSTFPDWLRATHLLNVLFLTLLARSGLEILSSFPKLYWDDHCAHGTEVLKLTRKPVPTGRLTIGLEEEESWSPLLALPGRRNLGLGRHWHFAAVIAWIATGAVYVVLLFAAGEWRRLVPSSWSIFPDALDAALTYLSLDVPAPGEPYNGLQQLVYFSIVFGLAPLTIASGAAMSPALIGRFPGFVRLFGGKQRARTIHFACLAGFVLFTVSHTALVALHGLRGRLGEILLGAADAEHAVAFALVALAAIVALNVAATVGSLTRPRGAQRALDVLVAPLQRVLSRALVSRQRYDRALVTPRHRINGFPPKGEPYERLRADSFASWQLEVGGLVERPLRLGLDALRRLEPSTQVVTHNCIQGWTGVAEWTGVPLARVLELCGPLPAARFVVFHALDDKADTPDEIEPGTGLFYETIELAVARHPQALLAYEMNGEPLAVEHGAPLRLRLENQLGFKMVKWLRAIELVDDVAQIGDGHGGWKEDHVYFDSAAAI